MEGQKVHWYDVRTNRLVPSILEKREQGWQVLPAPAEGFESDVYASPGWIDIHTHILDGFGLFGTDGDEIGWKTGVCRVVDAGTVGEYTYEGFRKYISPALRTRHQIFLCISPIGVIFHHDYNAMEYLDAERTVAFVREHPEMICGLKVRMGSETIRHEGLEPLRIASEAAGALRLPLMVHVGGNPPYLKDMEPFFKKGDILTHVFNGRGHDVFEPDGSPSPALGRLIEKGVWLDIGHGGASFSFEVFERARRHRLPKLLLGSDLHASSRMKMVFDMPAMASKLYGCGMSLEEILYGLTKGPAEAIDLADGYDGNARDMTLFRIEDRVRTYEDCEGQKRTFDRAIVPVAVVLNGDYKALEDT